MTDDEFIERECAGVDIDPELAIRLAALDLEDELNPDEDPRTRSERLIAEATPAAYYEVVDLAMNADSPEVRAEARNTLLELHKAYSGPTSQEK